MLHRRVLWMSAFLGAQIVIFYLYPRIQDQPLAKPLSSLPEDLDGWRMVREVPLAGDELRLLSADDTMNRNYRKAGGEESLNLMSAYFKSQRGGVSPHSPKVCLLGGGWVPTESGTLPIAVGGRQVIVNRYILAKDGYETFLLYWFAPQRRVFANEYAVKLDTLVRSFLKHRNDTSFVRVIIPILPGRTGEAERAAVGFVQSNFDSLNRMFPE